MTMINKMMKGLSFLLCLGFLAVATSNAWSQPFLPEPDNGTDWSKPQLTQTQPTQHNWGQNQSAAKKASTSSNSASSKKASSQKASSQQTSSSSPAPSAAKSAANQNSNNNTQSAQDINYADIAENSNLPPELRQAAALNYFTSSQAAADLGNAGEAVDAGTTGNTTDKEIQDMVDSVTKKCSGVSKTGEARGTFGIFDYLACKITTVVADLRVIVYILAGFGMIAFAYSAILGKINFKHLASIGIGLFILSMTTAIIEEIVFNDGTSKLQYGNFLPNGNHSQYNQTTTDCSNDPSMCPDVALSEEAEAAAKSSWSLKDLKNSIQSATNAVRTASQTYQNVRNAGERAIQAASNIKDAIENGGNIIDMAANIAGNANAVVANASLVASNLGNAASTITNDVRDVGSSAEQREYRENLQRQYDILSAQCNAGACNDNEKAALENMRKQVEENTTGVDSWLNNQGADIAQYLENAGNITQQASNAANAAQAGQNEGNAIGDALGSSALGNILGAAMGAGEGYTAGSDAIDNLQNSNSFDFRSQGTRQAEAEAQALQAATSGCEALGGTYDPNTKGCTGKNGESIDTASGWATKKNEDGSTTSVRGNQDGSTTTRVTNANGSTTTTTTNADGSSVIVADRNGHSVVINKDENGNTTSATADGLSKDEINCTTTLGGRWKNGKCVNMTKNADGCGAGFVKYNGQCVSEADKKAADEANKSEKK